MRSMIPTWWSPLSECLYLLTVLPRSKNFFKQNVFKIGWQPICYPCQFSIVNVPAWSSGSCHLWGSVLRSLVLPSCPNGDTTMPYPYVPSWCWWPEPQWRCTPAFCHSDLCHCSWWWLYYVTPKFLWNTKDIIHVVQTCWLSDDTWDSFYLAPYRMPKYKHVS